MSKKTSSILFVALLLVFVATSQAFAQGLPIYNNIPSPLPGNLDSYGYAAWGVSEFGDRVAFAPATGRALTNVTVTMSSWGCQSGTWFSGDCVSASGATFAHPITLKIYNVAGVNGVGTLVGSVTQTFNIPYRPSADNVNCTGDDAGKWYDAASNTCFNGKAGNITFNTSGITVPNQAIFGIAFNTTFYGYTPVGPSACSTSAAGCPYDSLNVGLADPAVYNNVGSNPAPNDAYQYTLYGSCANGPIVPFGLDAGCWGGFKPSIRFNAKNPALTKDDCKGNGWQTHTTATGQPFPNQGQCIQYVNTGK
ncbi:MAG TPA: hypothetical protein VLL54_14755 [Pyrinomonadaceae bacterium]|nr:hypothetical protein [Pyrinomonadaceae bacterium]